MKKPSSQPHFYSLEIKFLGEQNSNQSDSGGIIYYNTDMVEAAVAQWLNWDATTWAMVFLVWETGVRWESFECQDGAYLLLDCFSLGEMEKC